MNLQIDVKWVYPQGNNRLHSTEHKLNYIFKDNKHLHYYQCLQLPEL